MEKVQSYYKKLKAALWKLPMRQRRLLVGGVGVLVILLIVVIYHAVRPYPHNLVLTSDAFRDNEALPALYTCDGENINPPFAISKVPKGAKGMALLIEDTTKADHPVHWLVWNIPPENTTIQEGIRPAGTVARSFMGNFGYSGPCPAAGEKHTYAIHLYALSSKLLSVDSGASAADFQKAIRHQIIDEADLQVTYKRVTK